MKVVSALIEVFIKCYRNREEGTIDFVKIKGRRKVLQRNRVLNWGFQG